MDFRCFEHASKHARFSLPHSFHSCVSHQFYMNWLQQKRCSTCIRRRRSRISVGNRVSGRKQWAPLPGALIGYIDCPVRRPASQLMVRGTVRGDLGPLRSRTFRTHAQSMRRMCIPELPETLTNSLSTAHNSHRRTEEELPCEGTHERDCECEGPWGACLGTGAT